VVNFTSRPLYPRKGTTLPFEYDAPEPVWKISATDKCVAPAGIRTPDGSQLFCQSKAHFMEPEGLLLCSQETITSLSIMLQYPFQRRMDGSRVVSPSGHHADRKGPQTSKLQDVK